MQLHGLARPLYFSLWHYFFVDFKTALILVAISHLFGNLGRINFFRHGLDRSIIITFGIPSVIFSFVGASAVDLLPQNTLKVILGAFLIVISLLFLIKPNLKFPPNTETVVTGGGYFGFDYWISWNRWSAKGYLSYRI